MSTRLLYRITLREAAAMLASLNVANEPYVFVVSNTPENLSIGQVLNLSLELRAEATELGLHINHIIEAGQPRVEYWLSVPTLAGD